MKAYGEEKTWLKLFLNSAPDDSEWSSLRSGRSSPREIAPSADLNALEERIILCSCEDSSHDSSIVYPIASSLSFRLTAVPGEQPGPDMCCLSAAILT
jgi:hypothetical protein